jgi:medium-chain acyl-[acyl-carrier-protein] hydrolase
VATGREHEKWTVPVLGTRQAGEVRLLLFPFAGGGASAFHSWQSHFPAWIETYGVQYPGRETRWNDAKAPSIAQLVRSIADELMPAVTSPFAFLGHSLGGVIAFELARLLQKEGKDLPVHLFLAAVRPPPLSLGKRIHHLPDPEFVRELETYGGLPQPILENREFLNLVVPVVKHDFRLCDEHAYVPGNPLPVPITVVGGLQDDKIPASDLASWSTQTSKDFSSELLPGHHFFLFDALAEIARLVSENLQHHARV